MSKHTPGPWLYRGKSDAVYTPPSDTAYQYGSQIFRFHDEEGPNDDDLNLILAAPEMLAALRRAVLALAFASETSKAMYDDYKAVSAAIAKAVGAA